jgi:hypothetical protein|tara:strand:+ start:2080 stop:2214 length:135 start_codon:yes stop_codon:yes gene_type:complete
MIFGFQKFAEARSRLEAADRLSLDFMAARGDVAELKKQQRDLAK